MARYKIEKYNPRSRKYSEEIVDLSSELSFWVNCQRQSRKEKIKVRWHSVATKNNLGRKVTWVLVNYPDGEVWEYTLLSNSHMYKNKALI